MDKRVHNLGEKRTLEKKRYGVGTVRGWRAKESSSEMNEGEKGM